MRPFRGIGLFLVAALVAIGVPAAAQDEDDVSNEYRLTFFPSYPLHPKLTGFGYLGYVTNPEQDYRLYYVGWPGFAYHPTKWLQVWTGLIGSYTDNEGTGSNKLEARPFVGFKLFVPNHAKLNLYTFLRYEYRATKDLDTDQWSHVNRLRFRFGAEIPLTSRERAWKPKTFYALADVEPFYRSDRSSWDPVRIRAGIAYIGADHVRTEFIYTLNFTRPDAAGGLTYTQNTFRLNVKLGLKHGILPRFMDVNTDE